ncbi:MAG TPA: hypothetical protein PKA00_06125 [Saprospiraceae bacterium]|nr:hypothetical protein [Saprospiraceae bacterium]HMQ82461.1 hypothetical protein [Saprospiraceae bacterium]
MSNSLVETAKFIQHHLPGLDAGEYAVEVSHEFESDKIPGGQDTTTPMLYKFAVQGPRFKIDPTLVHSVFPPDGSAGEFSNVLPHVVLANETLPWIRKPVRPDGKTDVNAVSFKAGNENYDLDIPSWLAVLLLQEADFQNSPGFKLEIDTNTTIGSFFGTTTGAFISPAVGEDVNNQPPWINPAESCQAIKIPIAVFSQVAPSLADLFVMASVRKVAMGSKPVPPGADVSDEGTYSVVMGNRIPQAGQRHLAVLVSLENMQDYLPDHNGVPSAKIPASVQYAYLPVLASWNFITTGDTYRFDHLLESLNGRQQGQPLPQAQLKMYPLSGTSAPVGPAADAINMGYIPVKHSTRNSLTTASWYRGPLVPNAFDPENAPKTIHIFKNDANGNAVPAIYDADALLRLNPSTGLFELSYAAAWQLGRLLALQDKNFSIKLYQWKRQHIGSIIQALEQSVIDEQFTEILKTLENSADSGQGTHGASLLESAMSQLIKQIPKNKH